jgi:uncharacterized membrane protein YgcG
MFLRNGIFLKKLSFILKNGSKFIYTGAVFQKKLLTPKQLNLRFFRIIFFIAFLASLLLVTLISAFYLPSEAINLKTDAILSCNLGNNTDTESYRPKIFVLAEDPVFPNYTGFINDYTSTISSYWKSRMNELALKVEKDTGCEIAVAVVDNLQGMEIEEYAFKLFEKWGIGKDSQDNGILLLVSMQDRTLKIEVGYGLEGIITDLEAKKIIDDEIIPRFKLNDYSTGIYNGIAEIANLIYDEQKNNTGFVETVPSEARKSFSIFNFLPFLLSIGLPLFVDILTLLPWLIIGGIVFAIFIRYYLIEHKCPQCNKIGLTIKRKWIEYPTYEQPGKQEVTKWCKYCSYSDKRAVVVAKLNRNYGSSAVSSLSGSFSSSSSSSHSSSSFSSHHFSSGFSSHSHGSSSHHFGGGSSGGGGASGRW